MGYKLEKIYGCTLMAYVRTNKYWFAFHLGDGKMISFDEEAQWKEPVLWDDRCFLNKTTSICDADARNPKMKDGLKTMPFNLSL